MESPHQLPLFPVPVAAVATEEPVITYGWLGTIACFLDTPLSDWLATVQQNYQQLYRQRATSTQQHAWQDSGQILQQQLAHLVATRPESANWTLIFEYELPREGGRRPDLVLLTATQILVFEFKQKVSPSTADLDQVAAYARDLAAYHPGCWHRSVTPILVPTRRSQPGEMRSAVQVLSPQEVAPYLNQVTDHAPPPLDPHTWVTADYAPLPTLVQAARRLFQQEPLPALKRASSAGIPELLDYLNALVLQAQKRQERHLVLITGVPGAGKTLVGLQWVYQNPLSTQDNQNERQAVFLSGNGPLIAVLQYALKSRVFVQAVRNFYLQHEVRRQSAPAEHLIVFDEAQRAWDAERMAEKYGIGSAAGGAVLRIAERVPNWCVVLGLIGEGQEIHVGEEEGIEQWNHGLAAAQEPWQVHCPPEQANCFTAIPPQQRHAHDRFNLTTSLRTHLAKHVQTWVAALLQGQLEQAAQLMPLLLAEGFDAYLTRDLELAKTYCRERYQGQPSKRYGLLASSRARNLAAYGIPNDYYATSRLNMGAWYIDPPDSPQSCCALDRAVTEFGCQGLELDFPLLGWGNDLLWHPDSSANLQPGRWLSSVRQRQVRDPLRLRINSYRVLLTRGRDGFIVFLPPETQMDLTAAALQTAGLRQLS
ncbi:MAG: DUF2075 domain-containing protein [Synechococcales cyanobacterium C42_A2020_086]|jgi:hypothetical protein|nr:DUF2075 domain-containing protein [Synechococcales cyanobacterium C42_A2020_086]